MKRKAKKKQKSKNTPKTDIFIPNFTLIFTAIFFLMGALNTYFYKDLTKYCVAKSTGVVSFRGHGRKELGGNHDMTTGKKYAEVVFHNDTAFTNRHIYAPVYVGDKGDEVTIHYNPDHPDEYYIDAVADYYKDAMLLIYSLCGICFAASVFFAIYYNIPQKPQNSKHKSRTKK